MIKQSKDEDGQGGKNGLLLMPCYAKRYDASSLLKERTPPSLAVSPGLQQIENQEISKAAEKRAS
jgi:hypothetical protein